MIKFALKNADFFDWASKRRFLRRFVVFRIDCISNLPSAAMSEKLYGAFVMMGSPTKQTVAGRFKDLDAMTVDFLSDELNSIHDVGVSSGITSVELFSTLRDCGKPFNLTVSDKYSRYFFRGSYVRRIYSIDKVLLLAYVTCVLADGRCSWKFPISKILFPLVRAVDRSDAPFGDLVLYDSRLRELIRNGEVQDLPYDVFSTRQPETFNVIRCMNLLNPAYFKPDAIRHAISLLHTSLKEQGILLLGRTCPDGTNRASFYRKVSAELELVHDVHGGCEIKHLLGKSMQSDQGDSGALLNSCRI